MDLVVRDLEVLEGLVRVRVRVRVTVTVRQQQVALILTPTLALALTWSVWWPHAAMTAPTLPPCSCMPRHVEMVMWWPDCLSSRTSCTFFSIGCTVAKSPGLSGALTSTLSRAKQKRRFGSWSACLGGG